MFVLNSSLGSARDERCDRADFSETEEWVDKRPVENFVRESIDGTELTLREDCAFIKAYFLVVIV